MLVAAPPPNERERIALLHALHLLDTSPEESFDRITRLLARVLNVPIALVSLVDSERQWFKSRVGLDACETPRDMAFCAHAILGSEPLVVADTRDDPRFADNPLVTGGPLIRFYAGVPLVTAEGLALGTLCAIDTRPRQLSAADLQALGDLADLARREILQREALMASQKISVINRHEAEVAQAQLMAVFEQSLIGIHLADLDGNLLRVNHCQCEIFGRSRDEMLALDYRAVSLPEDLAREDLLGDEMRRGIRDWFSSERRIIQKNGELLWVMMSVSLVRDRDGTPEYFISMFEDIQQRKVAEEALRQLSVDLERQVADRTQELRSVLINAQDAYVAMDAECRISEWNPQAASTFGWRVDDAIGKFMPDLLMAPKSRAQLRIGIREYLDTGHALLFQHRLEMQGLHRDGREIPLEISLSAYHTQSGTQFSVFLRDISERKQADAAVRSSREQIRGITDNIPAMISYHDKDMVFRFASAGFRTLAHIEPGTLIGVTPAAGLGANRFAMMEPYFRRALAGESVQYEIGDPTNGTFWQARVVPDFKDGQVQGFYAVTIEITSVKKAELQHRKEASLDALTGLPNRRTLLLRIQEAFQRGDREGKAAAVLYLDLDDFKRINDSHGHELGDEVLKYFGRYLTEHLRSADLVARLAGDEFVVLIESLSHGLSDAQRVAAKIQLGLGSPVTIAGVSLSLQASIGIAVRAAGSGSSVEELLATADKAMYADKNRQRGVATLPSHIR